MRWIQLPTKKRFSALGASGQVRGKQVVMVGARAGVDLVVPRPPARVELRQVRVLARGREHVHITSLREGDVPE